MNQDPQTQTMQSPSKLHPLMPVDASGQPVNVTAFRPGGKESEPMMLPPDVFANVQAAVETPEMIREDEASLPQASVQPQQGVSPQPEPVAVETQHAPVVPPEVAAAGVTPTEGEEMAIDVSTLDLEHPAAPDVLEQVKKEAKRGSPEDSTTWRIRQALRELMERQIEYQHSQEKLAA